MEFALWMIIVVLMAVLLSQSRMQVREEKRLRDLEVRFEKLSSHLGFVTDAVPAVSDEVSALARTPGAKIEAIKAYRRETGAGLKEAKEAVERLEAGT